MPSTPLSLTIELKGKDSTQAALSRARSGVQSISEQVSRAKAQFIAFQASMLSIGRLAALANLADQVQQVNARLKLATQSTQQFAQAQALAYRVAQQARRGDAVGEGGQRRGGWTMRMKARGRPRTRARPMTASSPSPATMPSTACSQPGHMLAKPKTRRTANAIMSSEYQAGRRDDG